MDSRRKVFVWGAGVTGLVLGKLFTEKGWPVEIFEAQPFVGGLAATEKWDEFYVDFGPHIFHTPNRELESVWEREFGDLFIKGDFWCKNVKGKDFKEYYDYPLSYEAINEYPEALRCKILSELKATDPVKRLVATNYRDYVKGLVGDTLQQMFFEDYPRKIWGIPTEEMTSNWAPKRIEIREKKKPFYTERWNAVGKFGSGCIMERLAGKIAAAGGKIFTQCSVTGVEHAGDKISRFSLSDGRTLVLRAEDIIISTLPVTVLADLFGISHDLRFRGVIAVSLAVNQPSVLPEGIHFLYYDSPDVVFHRVSEQKKFSDAGLPREKTFITAEIAYTESDERDRSNPSALVQRVLDDSVKAGLVRREDFIKGMVAKRPCVYPLLTRNYEHQVRRVQSQLVRFQSLHCVGGPAEFNYADIHINFLKATDLFRHLLDQNAGFYRARRDSVATRPKKEVLLNRKPVGNGHRPFIIAEAGLNHNGSLELALKLIDEAKKAHCDAVKFQTFKAGERVSNKIKKARYAEKITGLEENIFELLSRLELSAGDHEKIFAYGQKVGIDVFSTPFDLSSVDLLETLNAPYYKIASSDLAHTRLLERVAKTGKAIILSTGMSTLGEIEDAIRAILAAGNENIILLHCLSAYPADPKEVNLNVIKTLQNNYRVPVGFSDHTPGIAVSSAALAVGANLIERHFTLDKNMEGPDHIFSSTPDEMAELAGFAAIVKDILGDGIKSISPSEYDTINSFKKSLYAKKDLKKGAIITDEVLVAKGPGGGLPPKYWPVVVGRSMRRDVQADHPITWDDI